MIPHVPPTCNQILIGEATVIFVTFYELWCVSLGYQHLSITAPLNPLVPGHDSYTLW